MEAMPENGAVGDERPRILIVEDEVLIRIHMGEELRAAGFTVVEAMSAEEALSVLAADPDFDVVITNIRMEGKTEGSRSRTGFAAMCRALRWRLLQVTSRSWI